MSIDKETVFKAVPYSNHEAKGRTAIAGKIGTDELATVSKHLKSLVGDKRITKIGDKRGATYKRVAA
jgi:hypothetical protein